ncbi:MAG: OOP family OmpA-OmpF porin [Algoriphagus sp.]|jgi:OOP family OmpA-OmpF porin
MKKSILALIALMAFASYTAQAQLDSCKACKPFPWEIGIPMGITQYFGDVHTSMPYASGNRIVSGLFARKHVGEFFAIRPQVLVGGLAGDDFSHPDGYWDYRGLKFKTPLVEASLLGEIYPFKERKITCEGITRRTLSPYLFGGIGLTYTNPTVEVQPGTTFPPLPRDITADAAGLQKWTAVIPFGLGVKWNLAERFALGLEGGYRYSFSDYLDGISIAANDQRNDGYFLGLVSGSYRFGDKDSDKDGTVDKCDICPDVPGLRKFQGCPDTDGDGLPDNVDDCPTVAGPMSLKGCPDSDGDGIADKDDECPTLYGLASLNGCPDRDGDGVADKNDECPDVAGVVDLRGCPDTDGDGIADKEDACPNSPGPASTDGCPDKDGDGIADSKDDCINEAGEVDGCPDTDKDGVPDHLDKCPDVPGLVSNDGCPEGYVDGQAPFMGYASPSGCEISASELDELNYAAQQVEFYSGTNKLRPTSYKPLQRVCDLLARCSDAAIHVNAYNDGRATSSNVRLAKLRACAIYTYFLQKKCLTKSRISYDGFGDEDTASYYTNAEGKRTGTRIEFLLR